MATYSITSEVPFSAIDLNVTFDLNVTCVYQNQVQSQNTGQALQDQFTAYAADIEESTKTQPYFTTQDIVRNATFELVEDPSQSPAGEGYVPYICTTTFTIENAVVLQTTSTQTELTGTERDAYLEGVANGLEESFKSERGWVDL